MIEYEYRIVLFGPYYSNSSNRIQIANAPKHQQVKFEYEYRIPLFGPSYSNIRIVRIIRTHSDTAVDKISAAFRITECKILNTDNKCKI